MRKKNKNWTRGNTKRDATGVLSPPIERGRPHLLDRTKDGDPTEIRKTLTLSYENELHTWKWRENRDDTSTRFTCSGEGYKVDRSTAHTEAVALNTTSDDLVTGKTTNYPRETLEEKTWEPTC